MSDSQQFLPNALVILVGWWVVHRLSARRDKAKATCELVVKATDHMDQSASDLLNKSLQYHCTERDIVTERDIKLVLQDLGQKTTALKMISPEKNILIECGRSITALRKAISDTHFEDEHTSPLPKEDAQCARIAEAVLRLKRMLLKLKYAQYQS